MPNVKLSEVMRNLGLRIFHDLRFVQNQVIKGMLLVFLKILAERRIAGDGHLVILGNNVITNRFQAIGHHHVNLRRKAFEFIQPIVNEARRR